MKGLTLGVYGTLLDPDVRSIVMGPDYRPPGRPARLPGWRRLAVAGASYPGIRSLPGTSVDIELFDDLPFEVVDRADHFEGQGHDYDRRLLTVLGPDGRAEEAWLYVPTRRLRLSARPWRLDTEWRRRHKPAFLANARAIMAACSARPA